MGKKTRKIGALTQFDSISHKICAKINEKRGKQEVAIDPATAIMIAKIVFKLVVLIKECKQSNTERENTIRNPTHTDLGWLRKIVREHMGLIPYLFFGSKIVDSIADISKDCDNTELSLCGIYDKDLDDGNYYRKYVEV
tara:strand:+ start:2191 stop:2607 length:417 start_codon:yes stop_codon:yes gene_type:complete